MTDVQPFTDWLGVKLIRLGMAIIALGVRCLGERADVSVVLRDAEPCDGD